MPDLLLELFSEEIPARMQARAAEELKAKVTGALVDAGLTYEGAVAHVTPRRLCLHIAGLPAKSPDVKEEKKGPRVGAPDAAIQGFLKGAGLASIKDARIEGDEKKGQYYVASIDKKGRETPALLAEVLPKIIREFSWPKSMRWGAASSSTSSLRWVRPLHSILCMFGTGADAEIVSFEIEGLKSGDATLGHRFLSPQKISVKQFDDYTTKLEKAHVVLDSARRRDIILHDAKQLAFAQGLELVEDAALLDEVAGLVEWPVVLMGTFDAAFLDLPAPVIRATIRNNQKCFVLRDKSGKLANKFILTSNIAASDSGREIIAGNERVVRARLSDAKFFFEQDKKIKLLERTKKLDQITFHEKLGTQGERVKRIAALAKEIAPLVQAKPDEAALAAQLAKADLVTEMVGEFPELQGFMGRTYAKLEGVPENIAAAIEEHYKPLGPADTVPNNPVSVAVALADKFDMLVGFWLIDEKPTGSKDPYALRRSTLGAIKIILNSKMKIPLLPTFVIVGRKIMAQMLEEKVSLIKKSMSLFESTGDINVEGLISKIVKYSSKTSEFMESEKHLSVPPQNWEINFSNNLLSFFHDRLRVQLREQGLRHDVIDAVLALPGQDDLLMIVKRIEALDAFLKTENGAALQAGVTRALNILKIEEKKDKRSYEGKVDAASLVAPEARALAEAVKNAEVAVGTALKSEDSTGAMKAIAGLRAPIDAFFDKVMVNEEPHRANRLQLLARIRAITTKIADFSKLEG